MKKLQVKLDASVFLTVLLLLFLLAHNVFACTPAGPDPWFVIKLSFDQLTLPSGIEIVQTDPIYEPYSLINKSSEPFYLVRENLTDWKTFPNSELPQNYEPLYKITADQVYFWGQLSSEESVGWKPNSGGINNSAATRVRIDEGIYILEGESRQIYQDNRPAVVDIPDQQDFKILGFHRGNPIQIKGRLLYSLNEKYDPQRRTKGVEACNKWNRSFHITLWDFLSFVPLLIILGFLSGVCLVAYKITKRFRR
jgi:hypothetical protein